MVRKINKSAKIRETLEALGGDARPKDVIAALAEQKIKVTPAAVSNVKANLKNGHAGRHGKTGMISISTLQSAKRLVSDAGSVEAAREALSVLAGLR